jgi:ATP-dependent protease HslVU (ClpYQ) peptidase subunit
VSVIIAGYHKGHVYLGGDSAVSYGDYQTVCEPKVVRTGDVLLGLVGTSRSYTLAVKAAKDCSDVQKFVKRLTKTMNDGQDFTALFAQGSGLFLVDGELGIDRVLTDFTAIGSGADVALGAMGIDGRPIPKRILAALNVVGKYNRSVAPPYYLYNT